LKAGDEELHQFDFLLTEVKNKYSPEMRLYQQTHEKIELIDCFSNIGLHYESLLPIKIRTKPCIMIMKRKKGSVLVKDLIYEEPLESLEIPDEELDLDDEEDRYFDEPEPEMEVDISGSPEDGSSIPEDISSGNQEDNSGGNSGDQEEDLPLPKVRKIRKRKLLKPFENPKQRIKEIIDAEKKDQDEANKKKVKAELIDEISKLDLGEFCDLDKIDKKDCLKKIIDENDI
jgi:alpha-1,6-mannosyltransferase